MSDQHILWLDMKWHIIIIHDNWAVVLCNSNAECNFEILMVLIQSVLDHSSSIGREECWACIITCMYTTLSRKSGHSIIIAWECHGHRGCPSQRDHLAGHTTPLTCLTSKLAVQNNNGRHMGNGQLIILEFSSDWLHFAHTPIIIGSRT